jgi:hypothetical protein
VSNEKETNSQEDIFLILKSTIEKDLEETGFVLDEGPPSVEPKIRGGIDDLSMVQLKNLYDQFLSFYEYLSDEVTRFIGYVNITKARHDHVEASVLKRIYASGDFKNAESRKCELLTDPIYLGAQKDYLYCKTMLSTQRERRDKLLKSIERLGREFWLRKDSHTKSRVIEQEFTPEDRRPYPDGYKPTK